MKKQIFKMSAMAALMAVSASAMAVDVNVNATVQVPAAGTVTGSLAFGTITLSSGSGTVVTLSSLGIATTNNSATVAGPFTTGILAVTGAQNTTVNIGWGSLTGPSIQGASFTQAGSVAPNCTTDSSGACTTIAFGGILNIPSAASGAISGTVPITLTY